MSTLPYDFVSIDTAKIKSHEPIWHDGSQVDKLGLLSGELHVTMTVKTPLLVGNTHYSKAQALPDALVGFVNLPDKKNIIEPLFGPQQANGQPGPVLINPRAIKGMIRHSIGALTNAPMERVGERQYGFRPNLERKQFGALKNQAKLTSYAAIVTKNDNDALEIELLPQELDAFIWAQTVPANAFPANSISGALSIAQTIWVETNNSRRKKWLDDAYGKSFSDENAIDRASGNPAVASRARKRSYAQQDLPSGSRLCAYWFGQDRLGKHQEFARKVNNKIPEVDNYKWVIVPPQATNPIVISISKQSRIIAQLARTEKFLANSATGHLMDHPNLAAENVKTIQDALALATHADWKPNQIIFVEMQSTTNALTVNEIVSLGHHFRYYWAYTDSVRQRANADGVRVDRSELTPTPTEVPTEKSDKPSALSGARSLFGYVRDKENPSTHLGKKEFTRLAGRITPNFAVEVDSHKPIADRFMAGSLCTALPILGSPKPSAAEFYLKQQLGIVSLPLATAADNQASETMGYGEARINSLVSQSSGLAGRKFYPHGMCTVFQGNQSLDAQQSDQASLVRFVIKPDRKLRCSIRFKDLRPAELELLLAALAPERLKSICPVGFPADATFAQKLGYGRPLGMGTIAFSIDRVALWSAGSLTDTTNYNLVNAVLLKSMINFASAQKWLKLMQFSGTQLAAREFHKAKAKPNELTSASNPLEIFNWHTAIRKKHALFRS